MGVERDSHPATPPEGVPHVLVFLIRHSQTYFIFGVIRALLLTTTFLLRLLSGDSHRLFHLGTESAQLDAEGLLLQFYNRLLIQLPAAGLLTEPPG